MTDVLTPFEGQSVISSGIEMPGAGGGLNAALAVDKLELHHGDEVVVALHVKVTKVRFDPERDTDALSRVHVLKVQNAAIIDGAVVAEALEAQRVRVEEAKGVTRLPFNDEDPPDDPDEPNPVLDGAMPTNGQTTDERAPD